MATLIPEIKLNYSNYHVWKSHITYIFMFHHLYEIVIDATKELDPATTKQEEQDKWKI